MLEKKGLLLGQILCGLIVFFSLNSWAQQRVVTAEPTPVPESVVAVSNTSTDTSMQPSTSNTIPPQPLSSTLGIGPQSRIHINGFLSAGGSITNSSAEYFIAGHGQVDNRVNFAANSLVGLQFNADLSRQLDVVTQFVADGDDTNGEVAYRVNAEFAFLRYAFSNRYQVRGGRFRLPAFLYSDTEQVGYSYPWVQLPPELYRLIPFDNINGVNSLIREPLGTTEWQMTFEPYYGSNNSIFTVYNNRYPNGLNVNFEEDNFYGMVFTLGNPRFLLRGTYAATQLTAVAPAPLPILNQVVIFSSAKTEFYEGAIRWLIGHALLVGEYARRNTPPQIAGLEAYYAALGYHIKKLLPLFTYAHLRTTNVSQLASNPETNELPQDQESYTLGFDYTLNNNLAFKVSATLITPLKGTFGLFNSNPGRKHVMLYGVSFDAIF